jgi:hypothetical protein
MSDRDFPVRMSSAEQQLFTSLLETSRAFLEFGCGGSTLLAIEHGLHFIASVDTDLSWIEKLKAKDVVNKAVSSRRLHFIHVDLGPVGEWGLPNDESKVRSWPKYYATPYLRFDWEFDLILIDGRFRVPCLLTAALCAPDSCRVLVHDYAFRHNYSVAEKYFDTQRTAGTLFLLKKRSKLNSRALALDLLSSLFDVG